MRFINRLWIFPPSIFNRWALVKFSRGLSHNARFRVKLNVI
jgi:hypothetical protein